MNKISDMEQSEFFGILSWATVKGTITMLALFIIGYYILPMFAGGDGNFFAATFISTFVVFAYVFKMNYKNYTEVLKFLLGSFGYGTMMYLFGEIIFVGMVAVGILAIVIFLAGDSILSGVYTYKDLKKWVAEQTEKERDALAKTADGPQTSP